MTKVTLINTNKVYVDGYKSIISIDDNCIVIDCRNKKLEICGDNLRLLLFTGIELTICGRINCINWK